MLRWADSFDHYGTVSGGRPMMTRGAWAFVQDSASVSSEQARTGTYSLKLNGQGLSYAGMGGKCNALRVIGAGSTTIGVGFGLFINLLPPNSLSYGMCFEDNLGNYLLTLHYATDGSILGRVGTLKGAVSFATDPVLTTNGWRHIEVKITFDDTVGAVEIKIDGISKVVATNLNLGNVAATTVRIGCIAAGDNVQDIIQYVDDIYCWDDSGSANFDFIGPQRILTGYAEGDTVVADWTKTGAANGYDCINDPAPDDDTTYLTGVDEGDVSEFTLGSLPAELASISGIYIPALAKLEEAGAGEMKVSLISNSEVSEGPTLTLTPSYLYWGSSFELDPDTGAPWTKSALEAATLRIEKTL